MTKKLLGIDDLSIGLPVYADRPLAVSKVSFSLNEGEILCVVGESGSGKSMIANAIMGLLPRELPVLGGGIDLQGIDLLTQSPAQLRGLRGSRMGMVFQEPMAALNPLMRVGDQIAEVFHVHGLPGKPQQIIDLLRAVNLPDPEALIHVYPHMLSGGQRQRVDLRKGETIGLVGESGSGKSTFARTIVNLIAPDSGEIRFEGTDLRNLSRKQWKPFRKRIQFLFQDPFESLDPRRSVGDIIAAGPMAHGANAAEARAIAKEKLRLVSLDPSALDRWPHEFSGGQRQRIGIARALAMDAELLIADEPVSALDVSVQAQILDLLEGLRDKLGLSMLFITHDMRVAAQICDRIAVMKLGQIVEEAPARELLSNPQHPYTKTLIASVPGLSGESANHRTVEAL
ncbi:ATP-binding cassette domain-containing protein [Tardiphaga sp. P5_C10]